MSVLEQALTERYAQVRAAVADCAAGRPVRLIAVSKRFGPEAVACVAGAGQRDFGENYAQEGCDKVNWFARNRPELPLVWHFIGPLQSNKTRLVAEHFDWVQSVDSERLARRLNDQRPEALPPLNVLVEVNIDAQDSKSGVPPEQVGPLLACVAAMPRLRLRGLMAIPSPAGDASHRLASLQAMQTLFETHRAAYGLDTLSMGMSADMPEAIASGATMVRVGTAIFGQRPAKNEDPVTTDRTGSAPDIPGD